MTPLAVQEHREASKRADFRTFSGVFMPLWYPKSAKRLVSGFLLPPSRKMKEVPNTMAKAGSRVKITLRCSECKQRNYNTNKNKKNTPDRLELNKYCPFCRKHTVHNETK